MHMWKSASLVATAVLMISGTAMAQVPPRIRGTIVAVDGNAATLSTSRGRVSVNIAPDTRFAGAKKASIDDIKPNSYIGTAAVPAADGTLRALEVTIFPEAMRGMGEGNHPWDLGKSGLMTNGAVSSMTNGTVAAASGGNSMTNGTVRAMNGDHVRTIPVSYKGGMQTVAVRSVTPVVALEAGDRNLMKSGARVVVFGPVSGNTIDAKQIVVGEDGVKPPM